MVRTLALATAFASTIGLSAMAQDIKSPMTPGVTTVPMSAQPGEVGRIATELQIKAWIDKPIYSSDGKKIGEVVSFQRDPDNKILGMQAHIGGYFGWLQTRVNVLPAQFKLHVDSVVLELTAEQAKQLPKVQG